MITFRRYYLDSFLMKANFFGDVLDVGGKKDNKRGEFRPPLSDVNSWKYLNIDADTNPDYNCSADNIPVENNNFDVILMAEVIEHLEYPIQVLSECYRILKEDGKFIATIPFLYPIHADPYDYQRWTPRRIEFELKNQGFKDIKVEAMGGFFAVTYDLFRFSLVNVSKNSRSIKNRIINRFLLPPLSKMCSVLDKKYMYKNKAITTGYYI